MLWLRDLLSLYSQKVLRGISKYWITIFNEKNWCFHALTLLRLFKLNTNLVKFCVFFADKPQFLADVVGSSDRVIESPLRPFSQSVMSRNHFPSQVHELHLQSRHLNVLQQSPANSNSKGKQKTVQVTCSGVAVEFELSC